jgi:hypothetical protein
MMQALRSHIKVKALVKKESMLQDLRHLTLQSRLNMNRAFLACSLFSNRITAVIVVCFFILRAPYSSTFSRISRSYFEILL